MISIDDKSASVWVMAWCHRTHTTNLKQWWKSSRSQMVSPVASDDKKQTMRSSSHAPNDNMLRFWSMSRRFDMDIIMLLHHILNTKHTFWRDDINSIMPQDCCLHNVFGEWREGTILPTLHIKYHPVIWKYWNTRELEWLDSGVFPSKIFTF